MPEIVNLPDGQMATLRDPLVVTRAQRLPVEMAQVAFQRAVNAATEATADLTTPAPLALGEEPPPEKKRAPSDDEIEAYNLLDIARVVCMVESWSYPFEVNAEGYGNIPARSADVLSKAAADASNEAFYSPSPNPDEKSPTKPSDA